MATKKKSKKKIAKKATKKTVKVVQKCSVCHKRGHNARTCGAGPPL